MRIELIADPARLSELAAAWAALHDREPGAEIFATPAWVLAWYECVGRLTGRRLAAVAVWSADELAGLFLLQGSRRLGLAILEFTGFPRHADRMSVVLDPAREDAVMDAFAAWLAGRDDWDVLSLRCFGAMSRQPEALASALRKAGLLHLVRSDSTTYFVDLTAYADIEAYLNEYRSGRTRKALRRHARRLAADHGGQWHLYRDLDDALLDDLADLDTRRSARGAAQRAFFGDPANLQFMRALARRAAGQDLWRISALRPADRVLAYDISFQYRGRRLSYQTAFDRELVAYSAGNLALIEALRQAIDERAAEFDFLAGDEGYKENWCRDARQCRWVLAFRGTLRSRQAYAYHRWVKPLRSRLAAGPLGSLIPRGLRDRLDI